MDVVLPWALPGLIMAMVGGAGDLGGSCWRCDVTSRGTRGNVRLWIEVPRRMDERAAAVGSLLVLDSAMGLLGCLS